jgi:hypothetical protein
MPSGLALVVGTVNCVEHKAELHPYPYVAGMHQERFKEPLDFDVVAYQAFLEKARVVLGGLGIDVSVAGAGDGDRAAVGPNTSTNARGLTTLVTLVVGLAIGGLIVWLTMR